MAGAFNENSVAEKFKSVPLCRRTVVRRITDISNQLHSKLKQLIGNAVHFSLCLDESTDVRHISLLVIFIRIIRKDFSVPKKMLDLVALHGTTKGIDMCKAFKKVTESFEIDFSKSSSIVADGAPAMIGNIEGFCCQLKKK